MGLLKAAIAFFEALDGERTGLGTEPAVQRPASGSPAEPVKPSPGRDQLVFGDVVEKLLVRVADLEAQHATLKAWVKGELEDAVKKADSSRRAAQRAAESVRDLAGVADPEADVQGLDAAAGSGAGVQTVRGDLEGFGGYASREEYEQAARLRAATMM